MAKQNINDYKNDNSGKAFCNMRTEVVAKRIIEGLEKRNMKGYFCQTVEEANNLILSLIPDGDTVSWGGSMTIRDTGLTSLIKESGKFNVLDRDEAKSPEEMREIQRQALLCDTFVTSTNAMTSDGELVNIDGLGNRVAALSFGPKQVIVFAGINKVMHSLEAAIERARNIAATINIHRFPDNQTPCKLTGKCGNCITDGCICRQVLITRMSMIPERIKVVVVNENLGF